MKKVFLKIWQNSQENPCVRVVSQPGTLLEKRLWHRCFPVNFVKILRAPIFVEHLWWMLLKLFFMFCQRIARSSCENCVFPQNFRTRKLSQITVFYEVVHLNNTRLVRVSAINNCLFRYIYVTKCEVHCEKGWK